MTGLRDNLFSMVHRALALIVLSASLASFGVFAQEDQIGHEEDETIEVDKSAPKAEKSPEPPKHAYVLELINVKDFKSGAVVRKQLENLLERGAAVIKTKSTWGRLVYEIRTSMASAEIKSGLSQMQLDEARLKSVSFSNNRFTVEVQ